jgi:hypothetical protein
MNQYRLSAGLAGIKLLKWSNLCSQLGLTGCAWVRSKAGIRLDS